MANGLFMLRQAQRVASVMSVRPARRSAPMARLRSDAMTREPLLVRIRRDLLTLPWPWERPWPGR